VRVILLTGKGGVGKTSLSLATALGAARHGHRTFVLSTDPAHSLGDALARRVGPQPVEVAPRVVAQEVAVLEELARSWSSIESFLRTLLRDEANALLADELLAVPGLEELVALRAIREVEATGDFDVCVVDCAPTGATLRMLRFPEALRIFMQNFFELERRGARIVRPWLERLRFGALVPGEEIFDAFERLVGDVDDVREILLDGERTTARLVVNPARVVVAETRRSFAYLSLYGVATDAVLVNRVLPEAAKGGYFARWAEREEAELAEIEASFPIPRLTAPLFAREVRGVDDLTELSAALYGERDPAEIWSRAKPIRLRKHLGRTRLEIDLPGAQKEEVSVVARGDDLLVRVRDAVRLVALPASVVGLAVRGAHLHQGVLRVDFAGEGEAP
jgi:arsenite-transporting ATPase